MTMVIDTRSRRERKKAATRQRILAAAIDLFSARGLEAPTVDDIAAAADIGKGTIYNYFETKEDIVVAFMVELERKLQAKVPRLAESRASTAAILTSFVHHHLRLKEPYLAFVRVFLAQMFARRDSLLPYIKEMQTVIDPPLEQLFRRLQERGRVRADAPVDQLVLAFKTIQLGLTGLWAIEGPPWREIRRVVKRQMQWFCEGVEVRR
jgi:AcrR family transcriptional regulator